LAVRLQLKLGAVTEQDQLADSPDAIVVVEPSVGSVARSKGNLYLLVSSRLTGNRAKEATRMVADTIRNEYYYDESAGIRQCLIKVLGVANKRLAHQKDRYGMGHAPEDGGPVGVAVAVVRGRELYVATVGPAEAYLIRQARLSTLPDPNRDRGLPVEALEPEVWRGELSVGDSLCLVSANIVAKIGTDALKDALVTLHPQSAIEHLHARFVAADGKGSDGALAFEANEVGATYKSKSLVPVRPAEPLAGAPDKSPIPLADTVTSSAAAIGAGATRARSAAGNGFQRAIWRIQDVLPHRKSSARKVTGTASRMEMQRRAAVALLAFVVVAGALGLGVYAVGGQQQKQEAVKSLTAAQTAFDAAKADLASVSGPGIDLINDDPNRAMDLLNDAYKQLTAAENAGYPIEQISPLRDTALAGLDRLYGVTAIKSTPLFTFPKDKPVELTALVRGSDGAPYVLDNASKTVWRIDLAKKTATAVLKSGQRTASGRVANPKFLTVGGPDVLVLDDKNQLWRWRPANNSGRGTLVRIPVKNSASWGSDVKDLSTFVANFDAAFYKLYVVDPSEQNIMVLDPANDGSGYPSKPTPRLPTDRPVDGITDVMIDGDIFVAENGQVARVIPASGWSPQLPADTELRPNSTYTMLSSPILANGNPSRRVGALYAFDAANHRIVAFNKSDGKYLGQYRLEGEDTSWSDLKGIDVLPTAQADAPPTLWWISDKGLNSALMEQAEAPTPSASPGASPSAKPAVTPKPAKTPRPTKKPKH
jgi:hypothetical protein